MENTKLNPVQLQLLKLFSFRMSETELHEIQKMLTDYYYNKISKDADTIWDSKGYTEEQLLQNHKRTPYK